MKKVWLWTVVKGDCAFVNKSDRSIGSAIRFREEDERMGFTCGPITEVDVPLPETHEQ